MNFKQQLLSVLSLLALTQVIKAHYLESTFEIASPLSKTSNICRSQFDGTILPHATDCQKFYVCVSYKTHEYNCDPNFHFDQITSTCVAGSTCGFEVARPSTCVARTVKAVEDSCYSFEICVNGQYQKLNCPANYYFHAPQEICVPLKFDAQFKCSCVLPEHTVVTNENNCETYYICQGKTSVLENCPLGQYYNSSVNACITDFEGICLMEPTKTPDQLKQQQQIQLTTAEAKILCTRLGETYVQFQSFADTCNKFYICVNGNLLTQYCPQGSYYDSNKKYCVLDKENKCNATEEQQLNREQQQQQQQ